MSIVVVGGASKGAGKTTLICGILACLPEREWTAIKITSHAHHGVPVTEERARNAATDTGRYLLAGARRALLVEALGDEPLPALLREVFEQDGNVLVESNRIASYQTPDFMTTDLCLGVLGAGAQPEKPSFDAFLARADALVARTCVLLPEVSRKPGVPLFRMEDFGRISPDFEEWMRARLNAIPE
ncbi:MAG: hypothetical protein WBD67_12425 [Terracidiphilus sp.]